MYHIVLFFLCIQSSVTYSQDLVFHNISTKDGLPSVQVYSFYQDKFDVMWMATDRGLCSYDGTEIEVFTKNDGLPSNTVQNFYPQKDGSVWCSTLEGYFFQFRPGENKFKHFEFNKELMNASAGAISLNFSILSDAYLFSFKDRNQVIKISNMGHVMIYGTPIKQRERVLTKVKLKNGEHFSYYTSKIENFAFSEEHVSSIKTIFRAHNLQLRNTRVEISDEHIRMIVKDFSKLTETKILYQEAGIFNDSLFWTATNDSGILVYDLECNVKFQFFEKSIPSSFYIDSKGGYWISTITNGVYYCPTDKFKVHQENHGVYMINPGKDGPIVGLMNEGVYQFHDNKLVQILRSSAWPRAIYNNRQKAVVINVHGRSGEFLEFIDPVKSVSLNQIISITESTDRWPIFVSKWKFYLHQGDTLISYPFSKAKMNSIAWHKENMLIGSNLGLYYYDLESRVSTQISHPKLAIRIEDIKPFEKYTFIATMGNGVIRYSDDEIRVVDNKTGLTSNLVHSVLPISDSSAWVATNRGLNFVIFGSDGTNYTKCVFGRERGLLNDYFLDVSIHDSELWIGTTSGLYSIDTNYILNLSNEVPNIFLRFKSIKINGQLSALNDRIEIPFNENKISFDFLSTCFNSSASLQYRYRISENSPWVYIRDRGITLTSLSTGEYELTVQASVNGKNWEQNEIKKRFVVLPPFYKTWWFISVIAIILIFIIYLFFRIRILIYNRDLVREIMKFLIRKIGPKRNTFKVKSKGEICVINSQEVLYIQSDGNYLGLPQKVKPLFFAMTDKFITKMIVTSKMMTRLNRQSSVYIPLYNVSTGECRFNSSTVSSFLYSLNPNCLYFLSSTSLYASFISLDKKERLTHSNAFGLFFTIRLNAPLICFSFNSKPSPNCSKCSRFNFFFLPTNVSASSSSSSGFTIDTFNRS